MEIPISTQKKGKSTASKKPSRLSNGSKGILMKNEGTSNINGLGILTPIPSSSINNAAAVLDYFHNATLQGALYRKFILYFND